MPGDSRSSSIAAGSNGRIGPRPGPSPMHAATPAKMNDDAKPKQSALSAKPPNALNRPPGAVPDHQCRIKGVARAMDAKKELLVEILGSFARTGPLDEEREGSRLVTLEQFVECCRVPIDVDPHQALIREPCEHCRLPHRRHSDKTPR